TRTTTGNPPPGDVLVPVGTTPTGIDPNTGLPLVPTGPLGTRVDDSFLLPDTTVFSEQFNKHGPNPVLLDQLKALMMHGSMSADMRAAILGTPGTNPPTTGTGLYAITISNPPTAAQQYKLAHSAIYLIGSSSQYQIQQ